MFSRMLTVGVLSAGLAWSASALEVSPVPTPAPAGSFGASLAAAPDGTLYLAWVELLPAEVTAMKVARFLPAQKRWSEARLVAQGRGWLANPMNFPKLAAHDGGRLTAAWSVLPPGANNPHGGAHSYFSQSADDGLTWTEPRPVSRENKALFFVALQPMPDDRVMAVWIDGRNMHTNGHRQELYANFLGSDSPDVALDRSVCDCCEIRLAATAKGLIAIYRGRSPAEIRDNLVVTYADGKWSPPRVLHQDDWQINGCPMNGPQIASEDGGVVTAWFTSARNEPRVFTKLSADDGGTFGDEIRLDLGRAQGRVDSALLPGGTSVVTWLERAGQDGTPAGIYARMISPSGAVSAAQRLTDAARIAGFPRIVALGAGQLLLSYKRDHADSPVETAVVTF